MLVYPIIVIPKRRLPPPIPTTSFGTQLSTLFTTYPQSEVTEALFGKVPTEGTDNCETLMIISNFLTKNDLAQAASTSSPTRDVHVAMASYYAPVLEEFSKTQLDRQAAGLRSNTNRASNEDLPALIDAHRDGLSMALNAPNIAHLLSNDIIKNIRAYSISFIVGEFRSHKVFRTKGARAGSRSFGPHAHIPGEMNLLWKYFLQLDSEVRRTSLGVSKVYYSIALAAMVLYGICEIHPFADGNGRVSRIYCNAVLKHSMNLPFAITIAATPQQRHELVSGMRAADQAIARVTRDGPTTSESSPILQPLIDMLIARLTHAILQLHTVLDEKARASRDAEEMQIARTVRERAAAGQCVICLEDNPNIATLCCGQAVHVNCIAEWLANGTTCVSCRAPLPRLNVGQVRPREGEQQQQLPQPQLGPTLLGLLRVPVDETDETFPPIALEMVNDEEETEEEPNYPTSNVAQNGIQYCDMYNNCAAIDCDFQLCGRCCSSPTCRRHGTRPTYDEGSTTEDVESSNNDDEADTTSVGQDDDDDDDNVDTTSTRIKDNSPQVPYCRYCNNRAAQDCNHGLCGRCCVVHGLSYSCYRHGR